ncbi:DUF1972 domain-containing protein, partial [Vibrio coralliirubri]|uniref:DUF1972 domain-containing protein n=1 Tax=Vibrio coralliirubri TaxID=1516159 RepID=UPI00067F3394
KANLVYIPFKANGIQSIPYDILSLIKSIWIKPDVVLVLGVSGCVFLPIFKIFSKSRIVTNIDGLEWKRAKWGRFTKWFLKFSEFLAVKFSDAVVTDNEAITNYVKTEYNTNSNTVAYGGDHAIRGDLGDTNKSDYSLALCRIEPENNVSMILESFSKTNERLKFIGNWDASEFGRQLKRKYSGYENIEIIDPIYCLDKLFQIRSSCALYIHGHSAGGTNPSLVEMMHFGVPTLAYDCSFNRFSTEQKAEYFSSSEELIERLALPKENLRQTNGLAMKKIAMEKYTWSEINRLYEELY